VYTSNAGLVDLGHVRHNADMVRFVYKAFVAATASKATEIHLGLYEGDAGVKPVPADADAQLEIAGAIVYADGWAHELATWGDTVGDLSAFSPEDFPSDMIGIEVGKRAIRRVNRSGGLASDDAAYDAAVDAELRALLNELGARSESETDNARSAVWQIWYTYSPGAALLRRNFDGTPWMAGMDYDWLISDYDRLQWFPWLNPDQFRLDTRSDFTYTTKDNPVGHRELARETQDIRDFWIQDHPGMDRP
jgi:hypothetical protein